MLDKLILTDRECENLAKGIAFGVGIGIIVGTFFDNTVFYFAFGGVMGVIGSLIYSKIEKHKDMKKIFK